VVEDDPDLQGLVEDLDCYRYHYYHNDYPLWPSSRMRDVRRVLGAPDARTQPPDASGNVVWWYGESFVVFRDRRVVAWKENDTPLEFGLEVAPRHYLPNSAFVDVAPTPVVRSVLGVGGPGPTDGSGAASITLLAAGDPHEVYQIIQYFHVVREGGAAAAIEKANLLFTAKQIASASASRRRGTSPRKSSHR